LEDNLETTTAKGCTDELIPILELRLLVLAHVRAGKETFDSFIKGNLMLRSLSFSKSYSKSDGVKLFHLTTLVYILTELSERRQKRDNALVVACG